MLAHVPHLFHRTGYEASATLELLSIRGRQIFTVTLPRGLLAMNLMFPSTDRQKSSHQATAHFGTKETMEGGIQTNDRRGRTSRGGRRNSSSSDKIDIGRLLVRILRHMATELSLNMRSDGYVRVADLLKLNTRTSANIPLSSHTISDIQEAVRRDNKQRLSLIDDNGELMIRANQGHSVKIIESESLLKPIYSAEEAPLCVHGTYRKNIGSILQSGLKRMGRVHIHFSSGLPTDGGVVSGMRGNVNVLIHLNVREALEDGMKLYISDNRVILTEGFDGVVPVKYFEKIESWPLRRSIPCP